MKVVLWQMSMPGRSATLKSRGRKEIGSRRGSISWSSMWRVSIKAQVLQYRYMPESSQNCFFFVATFSLFLLSHLNRISKLAGFLNICLGHAGIFFATAGIEKVNDNNVWLVYHYGYSPIF
jgi:hypothetical protein